jgi:hypothetical protein
VTVFFSSSNIFCGWKNYLDEKVLTPAFLMPAKKRSSAGKPSIKVKNKAKTKSAPQQIKPAAKKIAVAAPAKKKDAKVCVQTPNLATVDLDPHSDSLIPST